MNGSISGSVFFHSESFTTPVFETQNHAGYDTRRKKSDKLLKMANVNVKFNNKDYLLSCDDGQEESLKKLTKFLDKKYSELKDKLGNIGEEGMGRKEGETGRRE